MRRGCGNRFSRDFTSCMTFFDAMQVVFDDGLLCRCLAQGYSRKLTDFKVISQIIGCRKLSF
jgi:hypothetical protein